MGDLPLRTPTHRRLGGPLPRQLANAPHAHPMPELPPLTFRRCLPKVLCGISRNFFRLSPCIGQVAYVLLTRAPVAGSVLPHPAAPRLACVKPVASVHPEPGSNSSLLLILFSFFSNLKARQDYLNFAFHKTSALSPFPTRGSLDLLSCFRRIDLSLPRRPASSEEGDRANLLLYYS